MADVHLAKRLFPLPETIQRFFLLMPEQPDELVFAASAETLVRLQSVQQLAILLLELHDSIAFTSERTSLTNTSNQISLSAFFIHCFLLSSDKQTFTDYVMRRRSTCRRRISNVVVTVTVTVTVLDHR